ncbi:protein NUCLEAR FUSION DEFECTIVE 4-like isoform X1 [Typha angustifolia]|uniref:protein NUCLEAR FUSION DEFECTIVE 4-like isoform X1 n=1 Tax=Typha angustifolia TaxID=59011 RepID=UPI003C2CDEC9
MMGIRCSARRSKWAAMAAGTWIQCSAGGSYCFGVYSPLLKSSQGYDQSTLDSVAFFKDVGANAGVLSGLLASWAPLGRRRPWLVLLAGAAQCFVGYLLMWLSVTGAVNRPPPWAMCLYMLLAAQAQTYLNTADVVTAVENFPEYRGTVIGIMKGFLGLSGAILVQIYQTMFNDSPSSFLLMLALLPTSLAVLLLFFVEVHHENGKYDKKFLGAFSVIALCVAGYLMLVIIGGHAIIIGSTARAVIFAILMLLLLSPLALVVKAQMREDSEAPVGIACHESVTLIEEKDTREIAGYRGHERLVAKGARTQNDRSGGVDSYSELEPSFQEKLQQPREDMNLLQAMCSYDFWLLFIVMACGMGSGLATVNNISQIGASLGYKISDMNTLVSLWSIWNFLGRFGAGYISDYFLHSRGCARPLFIALALLIMSAGHVIISSGLPGSLYVGSFLVGLCYGSQWALMPSVTSEIFGLTHFGTLFNTVAVASPCGSYVLSVRVVGYIYDMKASDGHTCVGKHCFMLSFLIMACVCLLGFAVALGLFYRSRRFYKQVIYARLQRLQSFVS